MIEEMYDELIYLILYHIYTAPSSIKGLLNGFPCRIA